LTVRPKASERQKIRMRSAEVQNPTISEVRAGKRQSRPNQSKRGIVAAWLFLSLSLGLIGFNFSNCGCVWIDSESSGIELYPGGYQGWQVIWSDGILFRYAEITEVGG
jgi:hypothetical protein